MRITRRPVIRLACCLVVVLAGVTVATGRDRVEEALSEVRDVKAELHSRKSRVLGTLPGPREMAAHSLRCRPVPVAKSGAQRELKFDAETIKRAAKLDPVRLRKLKGRMGMRVLPLGITGAYVTEMLKKKELVVVHVLEDSPATGVLRQGDIIIGANGRLFEDPEDPRPEMGNALAESQSRELGGILTLHVVRDRKPVNLKVDLGSTLSYSKTWPFNCEKSKEIRKAALEYVMKSHPWDRRNFWTPTFLLASGDDAALELARRHICKDLKSQYEEGGGTSAWTGAYRLINLCEYYLLTGDSSVLPAIRHMAQCLSWAQYRSGSWSHGGGGPNLSAPGTAGGGYGEINCAGLGAFIGLCLARQCGIEPYPHTLPRSIRFFGGFCGSNFPYGLGNPTMHGGRMDNGMNSMAAMGFHLLGEDEMADRWARTVCYMWMGRERGHAEAIFSTAWGPVGAALAPKEEFHAFMNHMTWAYEMGRTREGALTFMRGGRWTGPNMTAAMGLFLYLPDRRLQVLGGDSVFAQRPPKGMEGAALLYKRKQWKELRTFLDKCIENAKSHKESATVGRTAYARKLLAAYERMEKHATATLGIIEKSIADGKKATAAVQLDLLARMLGEERPKAAQLRKKLGQGNPKDPRREKPQPLLNVQELTKTLELAKGGVDNGFAHSPDYIAQTYKQGFEGMTDEQIAGFFCHPSGSAIGGAVSALAERGEKVLPLLKRMLKDDHPGIRSGALATLARIYKSDSEEYRTEVPEELLDIIKLARPLIKDPSPWVKNAATGLMLSMKIVNDDIYDILREMAKQDGNKIGHCVRYGVKDPRVRTELCMEMINTVNRSKSKVPSDYKPLLWATSTHMDLCEPHIQTAVNTLNNPEILALYGFFSNGPPEAALQLLARYARNPLVVKHLGDMLRFAARKRGGMNSYWYSIVEYPHRIVVKIGPDALPIVEEFCKSEQALYKRIQAGQEPRPSWWKEDSVEFLDGWCKEMKVTAELVQYLYGEKPPERTVPAMCGIYLSNRSWGAWERQQIRDRIMDLGPKALPPLQKTVAAQAALLQANLDELIAAKKAELDDPANKRNKKRLQKDFDAIAEQKAQLDSQVGELEELASLVRVFNSPKLTAADVRTLCRFYMKRPWGKQYPFVHGESSYLRPLHEKQLVMTRDTLQRGGKAVLGALRAFLKEHEQVLAGAIAELDKQHEHWMQQRARQRTLPVARIAVERKDTLRIHAELKDLADTIECASRDRLSEDEIALLCRVYTRRRWATQNALIRDLLKRQGARAAGVIKEHVRRETAALPALVADVERHMYGGGKTRIIWLYDRAFALQTNVQQGIADLEMLVKTIR